ncbi:hypothetical protein HYH03_015452 [Edaphochlamys debaryana]|uniref:Major facilitator superfamily (MFS) profile domain-containing protein n=1 Tax=Edaphochlamys debaryana TaxID=47281 RepID=A0A835XTX7_9CHLO|nr:hypothetical protein HYH03_015452 [Edaphochlamys debaryana]|eukprot:KAG2485869.1 hypothetical protein HYH03_015452 [Edaphochlamys debaryana]
MAGRTGSGGGIGGGGYSLQRGGYRPPAGRRPQAWQVVSAVCAVAMLLCNFHRSVFTALLPLCAHSLALSPGELGLAQSSMLVGYLAGQLPAGHLADEHGGDRVLLVGLALWSLATAATAGAAGLSTAPTLMLPMPGPAGPTGLGLSPALAWLLGARAAMGLASSVIMPAVSAATAQWVPRDRVAATLAAIYAFFNLGGVLGLVVAPQLALRSGWPGAFVTAAAGGVVWALLGSAAVARAGARPQLPGQQTAALLPVAQQEPTALPGAPAAPAPAGSAPQPPPAAPGPAPGADRGAAGGPSTSGRAPDAATVAATRVQVAALCWCHGVIGWGFFVLQAWIPLYLQSLGVADLASAGLLASLPWLAAALTATLAGGLADRLVRGGAWGRLAVRRAMHGVSTLGCAAAVLPLAAGVGGGVGPAALSPAVATLCLVAAVGCYGASFGGFHAYVQDVASADAGKILGLTNTASIAGGIAGNLATGWLLQAGSGYAGVFWVAAGLYVSSWLVFTALLKGEPISLAALR